LMGAAEAIATERAQPGPYCLNCGARLAGPYCSACGQKARVHRSLGAFFADFAAGLLNFEGKFWRTLPMLTFRPGELTRRYAEGQRARFISPVALYLFTVFLMFAVLNFTGAMGSMMIRSELTEATEREQRTLRQLEARVQAEEASGTDVSKVRLEIDRRRSDLEELQKLRSGGPSSNLDDLQGAPAWVREAIRRVEADPQLAVIKVQEAASQYSWLLIPLSLPVLRLLFPLRRRRMYDHTIFVTYSLSFMMLLIIAAGLLVMSGGSLAAPWLILIPPLHMYRQLKDAYDLSRGGALVRTFLLVMASIAVLILWTVIVVALGALS
jgi:hypothetical protein